MKNDEDKIFDELLADKRHKEIIKALNSIAISLTKETDNTISKAVLEQSDKIKNLLDGIKNAPKTEAPIININQDQIIKSLNIICKDIIESNNKVINSLNNRPVPQSFDLVKNNFGITESVKVNYKPANKI